MHLYVHALMSKALHGTVDHWSEPLPDRLFRTNLLIFRRELKVLNDFIDNVNGG